ncbi:MAG: phosphate ABC transporter permease subunit PstC [Candidatus Syntrophoarchaeum sp. WYZ-LMO15]|nr:MAG: phosphate ABC transporter permease subunit PstC [Candidatus Syntrophoarchaeum sp. WYZ-LMO15]
MNRKAERVIEVSLFASATCAIVIVALILLFLIKEGAPILLKLGIRNFCLGMTWNPIAIAGEPSYGIFPMIVGSIYVAIGSLILAVPPGVACAIFLVEVAPGWAQSLIRRGIELLVGIPSVVLGFFGLVLLVPLIRENIGGCGFSILAGSIILAIMALPHIITISADAIKAVPATYREASIALGATKWQTIKGIILPGARSGIVAGVILGMGNSIGETMAVLMVTGNTPVLPEPLYNVLEPARTMTANIVIEMGYAAPGDHQQALFATGIVLLLMVAVLNLMSHHVLSRIGVER